VVVCLERDVKVKTGDLSGQSGVHSAKQPKNRPAGVRALIVAKKSGNADGAKEGRSALVPKEDKQVEEEAMLASLV